MIKDEIKLLEVENEVKPNKNNGIIGIFIIALALLILLLNEINIFHVSVLYMRVGVLVTIICAILQLVLAFNKKTNRHFITKYIIIGLIIVEAMACLITLNVHITMILLYPLVATTAYHSKRVCWYTLILTLLTTLTSPVFAYLFKTVDTDYLVWIYTLINNVKTIEPVGTGTVSTIEGIGLMILYVGFPRSMLTIVFGMLMFKLASDGRENIKNQLQITYLYETDILTDIRNRNYFEKKVKEYPNLYQEVLYCVYADANGLRDLNNNLSHEEGDRLLKCVAKALADSFGFDDSFRVGGDEFIAFAYDISTKEFLEKLDNVNKFIASNNYSASIGYSSIDKDGNTTDLISDSEQNMYVKKREYYQASGIDRRQK